MISTIHSEGYKHDLIHYINLIIEDILTGESIFCLVGGGGGIYHVQKPMDIVRESLVSDC